MNQTQHINPALCPLAQRSETLNTLSRFWCVAIVAAILSCAGAISVQAQLVTFKSALTRVTVPVGFTGSVIITNGVSILTNGIVPDISGNYTVGDLSLSAAGVPTTPAGLSFSFTDPNSVPISAIAGKLNTSGFKTNIWLVVNLASVPQGVYTISLNANGGATNNLLMALQVGYVWNGGTNAILTGPGSFSDSTKWLGGGAPGATDDVVFSDLGGQTNSLTGFNTSSTNLLTNVVISANTTIGSLRFSPSNTPTKFNNVQINAGATLSVLGDNGFSMMKDSLNNNNGSGAGMTTTFGGASGGLLVSNEAANFMVYIDNVANTLDMTGLGTFSTDVKQIALGDSALWPYYRNLNGQNAYGGIPRQSLTTVNFARTNIIKAIYADPNKYTNSDDRHFSLNWMNSELTGSSTVPNLNLGISNIFYLDSVNFVNGNSRGNVQFNAAFAASNPIAIFRGTNGGRMTLYSQADGGGTNTANSNVKSVINFMAGTLDMLVDQFYIGRDRVQIQGGSTPNYQGNFIMGKGTLDANTMVLGFREHAGAATNAAGYSGYCEGTLTVTNGGVVRINKSLTLGSTAESNINGLGSAGNTEYGQLTILTNSSVQANTINVGGPAYGNSKNVFINVSNSASLSVSNYVGGPQQMLDFASFANGSSLILTLNSTSTIAAFYATNYLTGVGSNSLVIAGIKNPASLVNGQKIPLFEKASSGSFPGFTLINNSGINGQIVLDTETGGSDPNLKAFQVILNAPKNLLWKGYNSADWDNTTPNWLDQTTGLHTNFAAGDSVTFDDSAAQVDINLVNGAVILPGLINMANTNNAYTLNNNSGGSIIGSATLTKVGTNSLTINGLTSITVVMNEGSLLGSGSIGSATINVGAEMNFSGTIAGGVTAAGIASVSGTIGGAVLVQSGGIVTNSGTMNSSFTVGNGGLLVNNVSGNMASIGNSATVSTGGTLVNRGAINGIGFSVSGTFEDTGEGSTTLSATFTANSGSTIIVGGDGVGTTTIQGATGVGFPGRVLLSQGSTNIFKVDIIGAVNTKLLSGYQDFGGSANARSQNGCTLVITNVTGTYAIGQVFTFFQYSGGGNPTATGSSTNTYPVISPSSPGPGLAWDLTQLWPLGAIGVVSSQSGPTLTNTFTLDPNGTNIVGQFDWPSTNIGWRLQSLVTPLDVGLAPNTNYNWSSVSGSWTNISMTITNVIGTNSVFYRLSFP